MADLQGRRRPDTAFDDLPTDLQPGDYWKCLDRTSSQPCKPEQVCGRPQPTNLTGTVWMFYSPNGGGLGTLAAHTVRENDDGTITITPGDGSSNSVLHQGAGKSWHGYVDHGVWRSC